MILNVDINYLRTDKNIIQPKYKSKIFNKIIKEKLEIKQPEWNTGAIIALDEIMDIINKSKLVELIGYMVQKYLDSHRNKIYFDDYAMITTDGKKEVNDKIKLLAYVCETYTLKRKWKKINKKKVYNIFGEILCHVITNRFLYNVKELKYVDLYVVNIINEVISKNPTTHNQKIISSVYYLTKYLISVTSDKNNRVLDFMDTLILRTQDLDISILTSNQIRNILRILGTKRRLYLRIFLVLSNHMIREKCDICSFWYKLKFKIGNRNDLLTLFNNVVIETIICLTAKDIIYEYDSDIFM